MAGSATGNSTTNSTAAASKKKKKSAVKTKSKKNENPTNNHANRVVPPPLFPHPMAAAARGAMGMMMRPPVPPMMGLAAVPPMMVPPMAMRPAPFAPNTNPMFQQQQHHHQQMAMMCAQQAQQRTFMAAQAQKLEQQKAELAKKQQEMDQQKAEWDVQQELEKEKQTKKKAKKTPKHRTNNPQLQILVEAAARPTATAAANTAKDHSAAEEESPPPIIRDKQGRKQWKQLTFEQRKAAYFAVQKRLAYTPALPTELSLPRGSIRRVAEEFGCMPSTIQRIWRLVNARIKSILQGNNPNTEQPQEDDQEEEHDDSHLMGTLHYFGLTEQSQLDLILRHHEKALFKSGAANRKKGKSKWDAAQIKQAMEQIPLAEQRSIRSLSRALNIPNGTLHKLMKDNQWLIPEQRQKITFSQAKQQLAQTTTNSKKRKSCPEDEDDFSLSFSDDEQQPQPPKQQEQQPENTTNTYGTTGTRQHAICETTRLAALIRDQTLCAHCHQQGSLELTFLATRASKAVGYKDAIPVGAPKLTCRNCQFVAFAGNATSKTILTPRYRNKEHVNNK
ncbi:expressed unknown protein [Seminavis robusta]|uniref:Uncharacterized protein n=1 Tax=Seminavis robusta TaxID=568900 RepID=A0A9N8HKK1_9STRA|nr:expressed unknown protein [Seminavis robusta]|eukprot:Sro738_g195280.1 n/a (560) ;mRNA; r:15505-17184